MADSLERASADRKIDFASNETSPDLNAQLRSTAARIRKSVTEGYITPPSSRSFTKAQSTTTIFASAKDINRDLFGPSRPIPARSAVPDAKKKRSRSADRGSDAEPDSVLTDVQHSDEYSAQLVDSKTIRATKPLRRQRGMRPTQSLPVGALHFSHQSLDTEITMTPADEVDEEDWSVQQSHSSNHTAFEPAVFN
ncbi:hypothetical protein AGABI1DRAFT_113494 [Agaricus bisporus var. burnettii JB137-S8]|nr:uncharacterized protein AGABI1DRAFT_113494 [Agaricus bisporus var. burnettii JB137-S8]EKM80296.1 hypothetical protein AGABI1DRAFT_113494 [Agaricus bisporus var. burnettii JB137-S8]